MDPKSLELAGPLQILPPVEFCCAYGSSLLSNNNDKTSMVDYILGVVDPIQWHSENLERNRHHYSKWMAGLGPKAVTCVADKIGVGVHFNPFVEWRDKKIKYGVVGIQDLARDVLTWDRFYLSGRLQKPVHALVDNWDIRKVNLVNLKSATAAALLLLPPEFSEEDLYAKICSLSYMGDLRMLFAEDKSKVKKIVQGSFQSFRSMYRPMIQEYAVEGLLTSHFNAQHISFKQVWSTPICSKSCKCFALILHLNEHESSAFYMNRTRVMFSCRIMQTNMCKHMNPDKTHACTCAHTIALRQGEKGASLPGMQISFWMFKSILKTVTISYVLMLPINNHENICLINLFF